MPPKRTSRTTTSTKAISVTTSTSLVAEEKRQISFQGSLSKFEFSETSSWTTSSAVDLQIASIEKGARRSGRLHSLASQHEKVGGLSSVKQERSAVVKVECDQDDNDEAGLQSDFEVVISEYQSDSGSEFSGHSSDTLQRRKRTTSSTPLRARPSKQRKTSTASESPPTSSARKKPKAKSSPKKTLGYAPPETYAHLKPITDNLAMNLHVVFVGINPGIRTAEKGHAYAGPSNSFWPLLHTSGLTPDRRLECTYDTLLPSLYNMGTTNIVSRPTRMGSELSRDEMDAGVSILEEKVRTFKPEVVCFVGKSIWEACGRVFWKRALEGGVKKGANPYLKDFKWGWQDGILFGSGVCIKEEELGLVVKAEDSLDDVKSVKQLEIWRGARVFVTPSTSGLVTLPRDLKQAIWKELGDWVLERRKEDGMVVPRRSNALDSS
ncbi:hypothetical protein HDV05_005841 [Chytridiales sp. JEL 0842]|nr:hypothetical protein HDV05_005841 [Chytridiales sp. JEL 0842]